MSSIRSWRLFRYMLFFKKAEEDSLKNEIKFSKMHFWSRFNLFFRQHFSEVMFSLTKYPTSSFSARSFRFFDSDTVISFWTSKLWNKNIFLSYKFNKYYYYFLKNELGRFHYKMNAFLLNRLYYSSYNLDFLKYKFASVRKLFVAHIQQKINFLFQTYYRSFSISKKSIVVPSRNLTFERRNLFYNESFRKYKYYFEKPIISDSYSNYIDYFHDVYLSKLFSVDSDIHRIRYIKESSMKNMNQFELIPSYRKFFYDLYYEIFLNIELFFPYYDIYNIFAFLF